jgi:hypothetical protein
MTQLIILIGAVLWIASGVLAAGRMAAIIGSRPPFWILLLCLVGGPYSYLTHTIIVIRESNDKHGWMRPW